MVGGKKKTGKSFLFVGGGVVVLHVLANLLVAKGRQLRSARAHDIVRGGNKSLVPKRRCQHWMITSGKLVVVTYSPPCSILDWKTWRWCSMLMMAGLVFVSTSAATFPCAEIAVLTSRAARTVEEDIVLGCTEYKVQNMSG